MRAYPGSGDDVSTPDAARAAAATTYNAAADSYDDPANSFWERFGAETVERLDLQPGDAGPRRLLRQRGIGTRCGAARSGRRDRCSASTSPSSCSSGPVRRPPHGGCHSVEFRLGDMLDLRLPPDHFDAVVCVFGIFFVPDMPAAVRALWQVTRPGGRLAITTWGPRFLEPATTAFWDAIRDVRPDLYKGFNPGIASRILRLCARSCERPASREPRSVAEPGMHAIATADDWWSAVLGTGYRGTLEQLDAACARARSRCQLRLHRQIGRSARSRSNVVYAVATKA